MSLIILLAFYKKLFFLPLLYSLFIYSYYYGQLLGFYFIRWVLIFIAYSDKLGLIRPVDVLSTGPYVLSSCFYHVLNTVSFFSIRCSRTPASTLESIIFLKEPVTFQWRMAFRCSDLSPWCAYCCWDIMLLGFCSGLRYKIHTIHTYIYTIHTQASISISVFSFRNHESMSICPIPVQYL